MHDRTDAPGEPGTPRDEYPRSERTRFRREAHRGSYARADVHAVLDAAPVCHVGYVIDGKPFVTPTMHWREGDRVYWHGSVGSRFLRQVAGTEACLTCTLVDGYVLARSAFNHAVNYRSAMLFGKAMPVEDLAERAAALQAFVEGLFPGRWATLRPMTDKEVRATSVLRMDIGEATVKMRAGPPADAEEAGVPVWAGVIPMVSALAAPEAAPEVPAAIPVPAPMLSLVNSGRLR